LPKLNKEQKQKTTSKKTKKAGLTTTFTAPKEKPQKEPQKSMQSGVISTFKRAQSQIQEKTLSTRSKITFYASKMKLRIKKKPRWNIPIGAL